MGNQDILNQKTVALFCSVKCPGNLILKTYDFARILRDEQIPVISGFHSPMERECLDLLLRGKQPVIICLAMRLIANRLPKMYTSALQQGRLLIISPFPPKIKRSSTHTAVIRNEVVAALAHKVFIPHISDGSKTEILYHKLLKWQKPVITFNSNDFNMSGTIENLKKEAVADKML